jgi:cytochrome P450
MSDLQGRNIPSHDHKRDPFPFYARLRSEEKAIQVSIPGVGDAWLMTRYEDVTTILDQDTLFIKDARNADPRNTDTSHSKKVPWWFPSRVRSITDNMLNSDDPEHLRLRSFVNPAFKRQRIAEMKPRIATIASDLLDALARTKRPDLVSNFAVCLPLLGVCELLGLPAEDWRRLYKWTHSLFETFSRFKMLLAIPSRISFTRYLRNSFDICRVQPKDDLISALLNSQESGDSLSEDELLATVVLLIMAGYETTANLIGSGMLALIDNPDVLKLLRDDPALMRPAVEELLRYTAPVEIASERYAAQDILLHGRSLKRGDRVLPVIASANRDERHFTDPDRLDIRRDSSANISFGHGIHHCIGFHMAKLEAEIAFSLILERFPNIALACNRDELKWRSTPFVRGLASLPVKLR